MTILYIPVKIFIFKSLRNGLIRIISILNSKHYYMKLKEHHAKKKDEITIHSSVVECLTYVATVGDTDCYAMRRKIYDDGESTEERSLK